MLGFHFWQLLIILLIVLLVFGARRLPQLGESLGQTYKMLQKGINDSHRSDDEGTSENEQTRRSE